MKLLMLTLTLAAAANAGMPDKVKDHVLEMSFIADCWSKPVMGMFIKSMKDASDKCMNMEPTLTEDDLFDAPTGEPQLPRGPKESPPGATEGTEGATSEDTKTMMTPEEKMKKMERFMKTFDMLKERKAERMSNLTCTLRELGMMDSEDQINMEWYRNLFNALPEGTEYTEEFKRANLMGYEFCYKWAQGFPAEDMPSKGYKRFGRQMMFHKCALESEMKVCIKKKMLEQVEDMYGTFDPQMAASLGLSTNGYEAAYMKMMIRPYMMPRSQKFVKEMILEGESNPFD